VTSSEKPPDLTPIQETSLPLVNPGPFQAKAFATEELKETPPAPPGIAPIIKSVQDGDIPRSTPVLKTVDSDNSIQQLQKKPERPGSLSPQTLAAHLMPPMSAAGDKTKPPRSSGSIVQTKVASEDKKVRTSPSTLTPKVQPPLPITVNARPNAGSGQVPFETTAQLPLAETIINVAIGRIEVHATAMESPKREHQTKGPKVMNLDDYMQQRSRGSR
jgi:hypothetical protein